MRATHGLPCRAPVYRGCPCRDPPLCHRIQGDSVAKRQPFFVCVGVVGVVTSCVPRVSRDVMTTGCSSCPTGNACTPARLEGLFKLSVVLILSHLVRSIRTICTTSSIQDLLQSLRGFGCSLCTSVCSVAVHLDHANANLFVSR